jgi:alpha-glucuronidase
VPLFRRIRDRHADALEELRAMAASWDALGPAMEAAGDGERFRGVRARLAQQVHDAGIFSDTIMSYYHDVSGLDFGP